MQRRPSLNSLRLFLQVAQNRSFSETSRLANVSQPALSRTIRLLEEELGTRLFDRNSRNVSLTAAGEAMLPIVERLTADFDHAFSELSLTFSGTRGRVVVGALPSVAASSLPRAIATFQQTHPQVDIIVRDQLSGTLYQQMQERQIDLAITTPPEEGAFRFEPFMEDPLVLVCRAGSEHDTGGRPVAWSVFEGRPFIGMAPRSSVRELTDMAMHKAGVTARTLFDCTQLATVGAMIEAGLGITALPRSTIPMIQSPALALAPLEQPQISRTIGVAHLADRTLPPAADAFLRHFLAEAVRDAA
jgi:LysR family transcriptional regulator, carnitine catabolism transcriptional activator